MAQHLGFHVISTQKQYVRPAVAGTPDHQRKFDEVNSELAYNLALYEGAVDPMTNHFTTVIPSRCHEASERWAAIASHPITPQLITSLRDDSISNRDRTECHDELVDVAEAVFAEEAEWRTERGD
jgi:hypothetical protein